MRFLDSLGAAGSRVLPLAVPLVITLATAGVASGGATASASTSSPAESGAQPGHAARLAVMGGPLPAAMVGQPYSYQFRIGGGGTAAWTGTQTLAQYSDTQLGRLAELQTLLNGALAAQQAAGPSAGRASLTATTATAEAPTLTYSVLAQLNTGALLDTDTVRVNSPGTLTSRLGTAVSRQLSAASTAGAKITHWSATGLPPGLSINGRTGKVTGKPSKVGTFRVTVTATDTVGSSVHDSGRVTFTWKVTR